MKCGFADSGYSVDICVGDGYIAEIEGYGWVDPWSCSTIVSQCANGWASFGWVDVYGCSPLWVDFDNWTEILLPATATLKYFSIDSAGISEQVKSATYTIDTTPPTLTLSTLPDGSIANNNVLNVAGTATDNIAVQSVTVNGATVAINADGTFSRALILTTGANTITTVATDTAGNMTTDVRIITLDQAVPVISIASPADNSVTNAVSPTVSGLVNKTAVVTDDGRPGERTDIYIGGYVPTTQEHVRVIIEVKACWHPEIKKAMKAQLLERYLSETGCNHGIYVVGWYSCNQWDKRDSKKNRTAVVSIERARIKFNNQADKLTSDGKKIKACVLNCALR